MLKTFTDRLQIQLRYYSSDTMWQQPLIVRIELKLTDSQKRPFRRPFSLSLCWPLKTTDPLQQPEFAHM